MANTIKLGNGTWATKEGSLLAYNDENNNFKPLPFTTTRASSATVVNKQGLIETVGSGIPRIDFSDDAKGALLLEPASTNLIPYSEDFTQTSWSKVDCSITSNSAISPDGTLNADKYTSNGIDPYLQYYANSTSITNSLSIWVKGVGSTIGKACRIFAVRDAYVETANQFFTLTSEWQRIEATLTFSVAPTSTVALRFDAPNDAVIGEEVLIWGAQIEENSYATSYIKTVGTTQTRVADTATGSGSSTVINSTEGVLYAEISALVNDLSFREIAISDGTNNNRIELRFANLNSEIDLVVRSIDSSVQANFGTTSYDVTNFNKVAIRYKLNDVSLWVNGVKINTDTIATMPINLSELAFDNGDGSNDFYGKTKSVQVYTTALSDAELTTLTTI